MTFAFVDAGKAQWPVGVQCDVLGVSRSGYYAWKGRPEAPRAAEDAALLVEIKAAHAAVGATARARVHRELRAKGRRVGRKRVVRLMRKRASSCARSGDSAGPRTGTTTTRLPPTRRSESSTSNCAIRRR